MLAKRDQEGSKRQDNSELAKRHTWQCHLWSEVKTTCRNPHGLGKMGPWGVSPSCQKQHCSAVQGRMWGFGEQPPCKMCPPKGSTSETLCSNDGNYAQHVLSPVVYPTYCWFPSTPGTGSLNDVLTRLAAFRWLRASVVLGPALAMDNTPGPVCFSLKFSSGNLFP